MSRPNDLVSAWGADKDSPLFRALARRRAMGLPVFNLATAGVGEHGIRFPEGRLSPLAGRALPSLLSQAPDPRGSMAAREAISAHYRRRGMAVPPGSLLLGPGTSLLYFHLFRLLCRPGDGILMPSPGYPLLDDLAMVAKVRPRSYYLARRRGQWRLDMEDLAFQVTPATRLVVVVAPHNPLGMSPDEEDWAALAALAREKGLVVVVDEVFRGSTRPGSGVYPEPPAEAFPLLVILNGLSKMAFLPGLKVAWMAALFGEGGVGGIPDGERFSTALERLSDTFLPVSEFSQALVPGVITALGEGLAEEFRHRMEELRCIALEELEGLAVPAPAGVHLTIPVGAGGGTESLCRRLLDEEGVYLHPGEYYGLPGHLVLCFLEEKERLREGCRRLARFLRRAVDGPRHPDPPPGEGRPGASPS